MAVQKHSIYSVSYTHLDVYKRQGHKFVEGDWISIDGSTGNIYGEQVATVAATGNKNFNRFMGWADAARQLLVMTNADNPRDAQQAVDLGAEGIGLCRTEHMFFAEDRIKAVREMICARTVEAVSYTHLRGSRGSSGPHSR